MSYTVTEKGTVTIPVGIRRKYHLKKGSRVEFIETERGALLVPIPTFWELRGIDKERKDTAYKMIRELHEERRKEASREDS